MIDGRLRPTPAFYLRQGRIPDRLKCPVLTRLVEVDRLLVIGLEKLYLRLDRERVRGAHLYPLGQQGDLLFGETRRARTPSTARNEAKRIKAARMESAWYPKTRTALNYRLKSFEAHGGSLHDRTATHVARSAQSPARSAAV